MNSEIRKLVKQRIEKVPKIRAGDLAAYMQDFERKKYELDYEADPVEDEGGDLELRLQGRRATHTVAVHLEASQVKQAFHTAFDPELDAIRATTDHVLGLGKDFGTLFLGGTIGQPGLRNILVRDMEQLHNRAAERLGG